MTYTSSHSTFNLTEYINFVIKKLSNNQQINENRNAIERYIVRNIVEHIRNYMSYEDMGELIEKIDNDDSRANEIIVEYINNYPELEKELSENLDHLENLITNFK